MKFIIIISFIMAVAVRFTAAAPIDVQLEDILETVECKFSNDVKCWPIVRDLDHLFTNAAEFFKRTWEIIIDVDDQNGTDNNILYSWEWTIFF